MLSDQAHPESQISQGLVEPPTLSDIIEKKLENMTHPVSKSMPNWDANADRVLTLLGDIQKSIQEFQKSVDVRLTRMESNMERFMKSETSSMTESDELFESSLAKRRSLAQESDTKRKETDSSVEPSVSIPSSMPFVSWKDIVKNQFPAGTLSSLRRTQRILITQTMESFILHKLNDLYWLPRIRDGPSLDGKVYPQSLDAYYDSAGVMCLPDDWSNEFAKKLLDAFDGKPYPRPKLPASIKQLIGLNKKREDGLDGSMETLVKKEYTKSNKRRSGSVSAPKRKSLTNALSVDSLKSASTSADVSIPVSSESPGPAAKKRKRIIESDTSSVDEPIIHTAVAKPNFSFDHLYGSEEDTSCIPIECRECRTVSSNRQVAWCSNNSRITYGVHLKSHEKDGVFICLQCHLRYTDDGAFKKHIETCVPSNIMNDITEMTKAQSKKKSGVEGVRSMHPSHGGPENVDFKQFRLIEKCHEHRLYARGFDHTAVKSVESQEKSSSPPKAPSNTKSKTPAQPSIPAASGYLSIKPPGFDTPASAPREEIRELISFTAFMKESFPVYLSLDQDQKRSIKRKVRQWLIKELSEEEYLMILRSSSHPNESSMSHSIQGDVETFSQAKTFGIPLLYKNALIEYVHTLDLNAMLTSIGAVHAF